MKLAKNISARLPFGVKLGLASVLVCAAAGCSDPALTPVDPSRAKAALETTLQSWKAGGKPEDLAGASPAITVQDFDWMRGSKLEDYEILVEEKAIDANLRCPVRLVLRDAKDKRLEKEVHYLIGTSPVLTVFRDDFN